MAEKSFRILLDFRELNFKFYKFVWMSISPRELVTIKDLKDAVLKKFSFERTDLLLFLRDGLLPEDENISNILRENDNVRLFYEEPSNLNLNESRTNNETIQPSTDESQVKSSKKRKVHSTNVSVDSDINNEEIQSSKKRKHSFSNGTYLCESNCPSENLALANTIPDIVEDNTSQNLYNFETQHHKLCKIKRKLKYTNDVSQNSLISENETFLSSDIIPNFENNENRVNFCKKKKKHKHSKDISENEILPTNILTIAETNESDSKAHKKKKKQKKSHDDYFAKSASKNTVSFCDETIDEAGQLDESVNQLESINELSEPDEDIFETVIDNSVILKLTSASVNSSSGISSLKDSGDNHLKVSSEKNCCKSYISDNKLVPGFEENNNLLSAGNNCKKKKRKRHRKRKSQLMDSLDDEYNFSSPSQKNEKSDSSFASTPFQTAISSPNTPSSSKCNSNPSRINKSYFETRSIFLEPFKNYFPNTSTPCPQTVVSSASLKNDVASTIPSSSNVFKDQASSVATSQNATQKKMSNTGTKSQNLDKKFSYKDYSPLNSCPLVGTRIAYKVLELDANYSPVVSDYKEGIVRSINSVTDELEIELVEPEVKEGRIGKFENLYEDDLPPSEVITKVTLSWTSLIDPVHVKS